MTYRPTTSHMGSEMSSTEREAIFRVMRCLLCTQELEGRTSSFAKCGHTFCEQCLFNHHKRLKEACSTADLDSIYRDKTLRNCPDVRCPNCPNAKAQSGDELGDIPYRHPIHQLLYGVKVTKKSSASEKSVKCGMCEKQSKVMSRKHPARKRCRKCNENMCEQCLQQHEVTYGPKRFEHSIVRINPAELQITCIKHSGNLVRHHCEQCHNLICEKCVLEPRGNHFDHPVKSLERLSQKHMESTRDKLSKIEEIIHDKSSRKEHICRLKENIDRECNKTKNHINLLVSKLQKSVQNAGEEILRQLEIYKEESYRRYSNYNSYLEYIIHHLTQLKFFIQELSQPGYEGALLVHGDELSQQIKNLDSDEHIREQEMKTLQKLSKSVQFEGKVSVSDQQVKSVGTLKYQDLPTKVPPVTSVMTYPKASSSFEIKTQPENQNPSGGLMFTPSGHLLVAECLQSRIVKYEAINKMTEFKLATGTGAITMKADVAKDTKKFLPTKMITDGETLYVTDNGSKTLVCFDPEGQIKHQSNAMFSSPNGIAIGVDSGKHKCLVVSDILEKSVYILKMNTSRPGIVKKLSKEHKFGSDYLQAPEFVMVDDHNRILVSDRGKHCIFCFDMKGVFIQKFGQRGSGQGQFDAPMGLCGDEYGNILVADSNNHRVCRFDKQYCYIDDVVTFRSGSTKPYGIALSKTGHLAVTDKALTNITVFSVYKYNTNHTN